MSKPVEKQEWFRVAEAFEASGLTQKEFASQRGLRLSTLQSWVYRRRRLHGSQTVGVRLLPVEVATGPAATESMLEVATASGARVRFEEGTDVVYVARLVAALGR
ncbi:MULTISPECIES: IS66 family insertion sequence element accessory protein TnpB [Myxococcus]|uniref:IS66 family insertion sequence element accessory protein TnpA n=1 Tax=Myxococcus TaxID=32 RepID=UPI0011431515|nr:MULTISPECIES: IS66 family insertion sequence element accessory protein TnpB [Myxococcus]NOK01105.1 IS66 family insertion sequence element accessory protein TnpB [Myxococcus xanthus]